ncbi:unnamed protein product [Parnassius mnemosyne]|uniref:Zinc finger PHD-type domain-containing protein n=1 Tax=Parnassius mnemosyne TaxID=213953 RepID=A0AAV1LXX4_9NEOP
MATAVNGFKKCEFWPYDPTVFSDTDFSPSLMTDIPQTERLSITEALPQTTTSGNRATVPTISAIDEPLICRMSIVMTPSEIEAEPEPGCSTWMNSIEIDQRPTTPPSVFSVVSPQQVMPYPVTRKISRVTRKRGKTAIITTSTYKNELEETMKKKRNWQKITKRKKTGVRPKKNKKPELAEKKNRKKTNNYPNSSPECDNEEDNIPCFYCYGKYLDSNEGWAACSLCGNWAHCSCAGIDDEDDEAIFVCEFCDQI